MSNITVGEFDRIIKSLYTNDITMAKTIYGEAGQAGLKDTVIKAVRATPGQGKTVNTYELVRSNDEVLAAAIVDTDTTIGNNDIISLASDISSSQLWFSHVGNDLKISVIGTSDSYTVKDWYSGASNQVEQIKAANGKALSNTNAEKLVQAMSTLSAPVAGTTSLPTTYQTTLNPVIAANWQ